VAFPGVAAVLVENEVRSETVKAEGVSCDAPALERIVREVADKSADACRRMGLGGVRRCELKTTVGPLSIHQFQDTRLGLLFREGASTTQVRTVTQQCLDLMVETMGQIHENHS